MFKKILLISFLFLAVLVVSLDTEAATVSLSEEFSNYPLVSLVDINKENEQKFKQSGSKGFYDKDLSKYKILATYTGQGRSIALNYLNITKEWAEYTDELLRKAKRTFGDREVLVKDKSVQQWLLTRVSIANSMKETLNVGDPVYLYVRYIGTNKNGSFYYIENFEKYTEEKLEVDKNLEKYQKGLEYLKRGEYEKADKEFSSLSDSVFASSSASRYLVYLSSAKQSLSKKEYNAALKYIEQAIDNNPTDPHVKYIVDAYVTKDSIRSQQNFYTLEEKLDRLIENQVRLEGKIESLEQEIQSLRGSE